MIPARRPTLVIFVKEPRPGRVKTRLGREIGMVAAAGWFRRQATGLIRRLAADPRWRTAIAVSPDAEGMASRVWPPDVPRIPQGRGDLGARMGRVFRRAPPGPVAIIGADIPGVSRARIMTAFRALGRAEAVIGPAEDGGYWLIGLARDRRPAPASLFEGVRWSGPHAADDTVRSLGGIGLARQETLGDVDDRADLIRLCGRGALR